MIPTREPGGGGDQQGAEAAPEPYAASLRAPFGDAETGSGLAAAVACVCAAGLAFVLPILAVHLLEGPPPVVEDLAVVTPLQSQGRPAAVRPAYRVHVVPELHLRVMPPAPVCESQAAESP